MISGIDGASRMSSVLGLNVSPSTPTVLPRRLPPSAADTLRAMALAVIVDGEDCLDDPQWRVVVLTGLDQCAGILRKTRAAEAGTGMQELRADAVIEADAARDVLDIRAGPLGQIGDFIDEGDLGREERVGGVFDQLGGAPTRYT